jgi:GAF domain-containing protein
LLEQQMATSELLGVLSSSKFELHPILRPSWTLRCGSAAPQAPRSFDWTVGSTALRSAATSIQHIEKSSDAIKFRRGRERSSVVRSRADKSPKSKIVGPIRFMRKSRTPKSEGRTLIGVPPMREGESIGVIALARHRVEPFVEREIKLVRTFADQVVIAIEALAREREIVDQARSAEQALDLLASVSREASTAVDLRALALDCLVQFGRSGRWQFGQLWHPEPGADVIKCSSESHFGGAEFTDFHLSSIDLGLQKDEDIPGRVWKSREPVWIADLNNLDNFLRIQAARAMNFKSALAFPVTVDDEVIVIFELYSNIELPLNHTVMEAVVKLGRLLGDILVRKRSELALREAHSELERVSQFAAMGVMTASIGHEIRQPLAAMVVNANAGLRWISTAQPDLHEGSEAFKKIVSDGQRTSDVLETIRAMFKKDNQVIDLVDINELIQEVLALVHFDVRRQRVSVRTELANKVPLLLGNRIQLQQGRFESNHECN